MENKPRTQIEFRRLVHRCIKRAEKIYGINFGRVTITFDLRGSCAALAIQDPHPHCGVVYKLRFNKEALRVNWDDMVNSTIPHEVAHLVDFSQSVSDDGPHNDNWRKIAIRLGDRRKGAIHHSLTLTPARRLLRFIYRNGSGASVAVGRSLHRKLQEGECSAIVSERNFFYAGHFLHTAVQ